MMAESTPGNFCQNNTVMLTYSRVLNKRDYLLINYSIFSHPLQRYLALHVYQFWKNLQSYHFIPGSRLLIHVHSRQR